MQILLFSIINKLNIRCGFIIKIISRNNFTYNYNKLVQIKIKSIIIKNILKLKAYKKDQF